MSVLRFADKKVGTDSTIQLSIQEAAKKINVSVATIRNWIKNGFIAGVKGNRIV